MTQLTNLNNNSLMYILLKQKNIRNVFSTATTSKHILSLSRNRLNSYNNIHAILTLGLQEIRKLKKCSQFPKNVKTYLNKLVTSNSKSKLNKNQTARIKTEFLRFIFSELSSQNIHKQISKKMVNDIMNHSNNADLDEFEKFSKMYKQMMTIYC